MENNDYQPIPFAKITWDIRRQGRSWGKKSHARYQLTPKKIELIQGKLFWTERDRLIMLGLLLENVGVDKAVRLGDLAVWREAIAHLDEPLDMETEED